MADTVKLASLRVSAGMDATNYVKGAEAISAANGEMSATAKNASTTIATTQTKVNSAGDIWTRLSRQYVEGASASQKMQGALRTLQRGLDTSNVTMEQAEQIIDGLNRKLGIMASADELAANGQAELAAAVTRVNGRMAQAVPAHNAVAQVGRKNAFVLQNLAFQLNDVVSGFAMGQKPMQIFAQQGGQIYQALSMGEGGVGGSLRAIMGLLVRFAPILIPIAAGLGAMALGVAGLTSALDKSTGKNITFMETAKALFQTLGDGIKGLLGPVTHGIATWFGNLVQQVSPGVAATTNAIVGGFKLAFDDIRDIFSALPGVVGDGATQAANAVLQVTATLINTMAGKLNSFLDVVAPRITVLAGPNAGQQMRMGGLPVLPTNMRAPIIMNGYQNDAANLATHLGQNAANDLGVDYAGEFYTDLQRHALADYNADHKGKGGKRDPWAQLMTSAANDTRTLQAQAAALGQSTQQTGYLEEKQKLLNRAYQDNIKLSPDQLAAIDSQAKAYGNAKAQLQTLTDLYNTGKQASEDFFSTIKQDLMDGTNLWGSFGDAASKVLDDIANKALQMAADGIWDDIWGGATKGASGSSGGFLGSIISGIGSLFGHNATGTDFWRGGMTWVGERGPELVSLPRSAQVLSNPASMAMMGAANANTPAAANANSGGALRIELVTSVDKNGNLANYVRGVSGQVAGQAVAPVAKAVSRLSQPARFG